MHVYIHTHIYVDTVYTYIIRGSNDIYSTSAIFDMRFHTKYCILLYIMSKPAVS